MASPIYLILTASYKLTWLCAVCFLFKPSDFLYEVLFCVLHEVLFCVFFIGCVIIFSSSGGTVEFYQTHFLYSWKNIPHPFVRQSTIYCASFIYVVVQNFCLFVHPSASGVAYYLCGFYSVFKVKKSIFEKSIFWVCIYSNFSGFDLLLLNLLLTQQHLNSKVYISLYVLKNDLKVQFNWKFISYFLLKIL